MCPCSPSSAPSADAVGVIDTVVLLEAAAIALGASALTPERLGRARATDAALRACWDDPSTAARLARGFHQTLLAACPNTHLLDLLGSQPAAACRAATMADIPADELDRVASDHDEILDMIAARAPAVDLERALRSHATRSPLCAMSLSNPA